MNASTDTLLERTYRLLDGSNESMAEIADGAGVNYHWLRKFALRTHADPGVNRVERLFRYLSERAANDAAA